MYPLMWAAIAFAFGIALAQLSGADWRVWLGSAFILGVAALALKDDRTGPYLALTAVSLAGALTYQFQISNVSEHRIKRIYDETRIESGTPVEIDGRLVGLPEPAYDGAFIRVLVRRLQGMTDPAKSIVIWAGVTAAALAHLGGSPTDSGRAWSMAAITPCSR